MGTTILVGEQLTDEMVEAGQKLSTAVKEPLDIVAAFWLNLLETNEWRLALVSQRVDTEGSREMYLLLWDQLYSKDGRRKVYGLDLNNITVLSPRDRLVAALIGANLSYKQLVGHDLAGQRLQGIELNGTYVPDIYIYFINDSLKAPRGAHWTI
jgi:hypothetical protein